MPLILGLSEAKPDSTLQVDSAISPRRDYHLRRLAPIQDPMEVKIPSRKRKRSGNESLSLLEIQTGHENRGDELDEDDSAEVAVSTFRKQRRLRLSAVQLPQLVFPRSQYVGWASQLPVSEEKDVLVEFLDVNLKSSRHDHSSEELNISDSTPYLSFVLTDFCIYRPSHGLHPDELVSLHNLQSNRGQNVYLLDGVLCHGSFRRYVRRVRFELLSIGNYEDTSQHTVGQNLWLQSTTSRRFNVWYQLQEPAREYRRYFEPFLWLADFSKHFVDFLDSHDRICLHDFRNKFHSWIMKLHGNDSRFQKWLMEYDDTDFRRVIAANPGFLWNQARDLNHVGFANHPLSMEVHPSELGQVKEQVAVESSTLVTPFVYKCFKHMSWARFLEPRKPSPRALKTRRGKNVASNRTSDPSLDPGLGTVEGIAVNRGTVPEQTRLRECQIPQQTINVKIGDVVCVSKDTETSWKGITEIWFAYVQALQTDQKGRIILHVIWLYAPSDTTCSTGRYPFANELFFSDNCNCGDGRLESTEVTSKVSVAFFSGPQQTAAEYFVRQKYTHEETFVTLKKGDFQCFHRCAFAKTDIEELMEDYQVGDSILVSRLAKDPTCLEPVEIVEIHQTGTSGKLKVRRLMRRCRDYGDSGARPNELVYTDEIVLIPVSAVHRRCHVRFFTTEELKNAQIPAPYNRDGNADAYYITCREAGTRSPRLEPLHKPFPSTLIQGFDPKAPPVKTVMKGMDLFCGGGNFGRGLEEGGAILNKWAIDWNTAAMHTYRANLREVKDTQLYNGSVNDYLAHAMKGSSAKEIAKAGEVDFISAGSPCQGYSIANITRDSENALKYCSMIASVAAFIDFYRPKYALLENVASMAKKGERGSKENAFSQMLCTLVAMGYQVQQFYLDAWSFGSPQSRSRLFISVAAPGLKLPPHPELSHSHPANTKQRSLGRGANGLDFGSRLFGATPYQYVTASEATSDLPSIGDSRVSVCIPYPDHRTSRIESTNTRVLISHVPRFPYRETFMTAYRRGRMSEPQVNAYPLESRVRGSAKSKTWARLNPDGLFPTITTAIRPQDGRAGASLHWDEQRLMTVMEARRAQGFPDREVLIGSPAAQWKIIGNSVARQVALALGMSLRTAWLANEPDEPAESRQVKQAVTTSPQQQRATAEQQRPIPFTTPNPRPSTPTHPTKIIEIPSDTDSDRNPSHQILSDLQTTIPNRPSSAPQRPHLSLSVSIPARTTVMREVTRSETRVTRTTTTTRQYLAAALTKPTTQQRIPAPRPRSAVQSLVKGYRALFGDEKMDVDVDVDGDGDGDEEMRDVGTSQASPIQIDD